MSKKAEDIKETPVKEKIVKAKVEPVVLQARPVESSFYVYEIREHSRRIFGVRPEILDGALFDYAETQITKSEAEKRIRAFMAQEVKKL